MFFEKNPFQNCVERPSTIFIRGDVIFFILCPQRIRLGHRIVHSQSHTLSWFNTYEKKFLLAVAKKLQKQPFLWALKILKFRFWLFFCGFFTKNELESALHVGIRQTFFSRRSEYFSELEKNVVGYHKNFFSPNFLCRSATAGGSLF